MSGNIQVVVTGTFLLRTLFRPEQWIEWVAIALGDANIFKLLKSLLYCGLISRVAQIVLVFEGTLQKILSRETHCFIVLQRLHIREGLADGESPAGTHTYTLLFYGEINFFE
jgi:hypothetical protein